jgi:hypothetical protein
MMWLPLCLLLAAIHQIVAFDDSEPFTGLFDFEKQHLTTEALAQRLNHEYNDQNSASILSPVETAQSEADYRQNTAPCKAYPGTPDWPSRDVWDAFNSTLGGVLVKTVPLAAPCFKNWPELYGNATCFAVTTKWASFQYQYVLSKRPPLMPVPTRHQCRRCGQRQLSSL